MLCLLLLQAHKHILILYACVENLFNSTPTKDVLKANEQSSLQVQLAGGISGGLLFVLLIVVMVVMVVACWMRKHLKQQR